MYNAPDMGDAALDSYLDTYSRNQDAWEKELEHRRTTPEYLQIPGTRGDDVEDYKLDDEFDYCSHEYPEYDEKHYNLLTNEWESCNDYQENES